MAYDLHIVRTENWLDAASAPITKADVDALIEVDSELAWSVKDYIEMSNEAGAVTRYWMIMWCDQPCFWWYRDQIQCSGPDEAQITKLVRMARVLNGHVVGDDGEIYPLEQPPAPPKPTPSPSPPTGWPLWKQLLAAFILGCILLALKLLIFGH